MASSVGRGGGSGAESSRLATSRLGGKGGEARPGPARRRRRAARRRGAARRRRRAPLRACRRAGRASGWRRAAPSEAAAGGESGKDATAIRKRWDRRGGASAGTAANSTRPPNGLTTARAGAEAGGRSTAARATTTDDRSGGDGGETNHMPKPQTAARATPPVKSATNPRADRVRGTRAHPQVRRNRSSCPALAHALHAPISPADVYAGLTASATPLPSPTLAPPGPRRATVAA